MTIRRWLSVLLLSAFFLLKPSQPVANAQESSWQPVTDHDYSLSLEQTVNLDPNGQTKVSEKYQLTNLTATKYLANYAILLDQTGIKSASTAAILAADQITTTVTQPSDLPDSSLITLRFHQELVGQDKDRQFTLAYEATQAQQKIGGATIFRLPLHQSIRTLDSHQLTLKIAPELGEPLYLSLEPDHQVASVGSQATYTYEHFQPDPQQPLLLIFGQEQKYLLANQLVLQNHSNATSTIQIMLPGNNNYQTLTYLTLQPPPEEISQRDGNLIASYPLKPQENLALSYEALVNLNLAPMIVDRPDFFTQLESQNDLEDELKTQLFAAQTKLTDDQTTNLTFSLLSDAAHASYSAQLEQQLANPFHFEVKNHPNFLLNQFGFKQLTVYNHTGLTWNELDLTVQNLTDQGIQINFDTRQLQQPLLPFAQQKITLRLKPASYLEFKTSYRSNYLFTLTSQAHVNSDFQPVIQQFELTTTAPQLAALAGGVLTAGLITGCLLVFRRAKKSALRR